MSLSCCVMSLSRRVVARRPLKPFQYQQHADLTSNQRSVSAGRRAGGGGICKRRLLAPPAAACCRLLPPAVKPVRLKVLPATS